MRSFCPPANPAPTNDLPAAYGSSDHPIHNSYVVVHYTFMTVLNRALVFTLKMVSAAYHFVGVLIEYELDLTNILAFV